jgi:hypothetical protein
VEGKLEDPVRVSAAQNLANGNTAEHRYRPVVAAAAEDSNVGKGLRSTGVAPAVPRRDNAPRLRQGSLEDSYLRWKGIGTLPVRDQAQEESWVRSPFGD